MPIKNKNMNMGIIKGDIPLKSVMVGTKCVYGYDLSAFKFLYPSITKGTGFYIEVNGILKLSEPNISGELEVHYGDRVIVRTYAKSGYENPDSSVMTSGNLIDGIDYAINVDGISIIRSTSYDFIVRGNCSITLEEAIPVPKFNVSVKKDIGIDKVSIYYTKSAYEYSGINNPTFLIMESLVTTSDDTIQLYLYSEILQRNPYSVAYEGYKAVSTTKNYSGLLTADNQCTVNAVSQAGTKVSIVCPPISHGVTEYALSMISSEYSRNINSDTQFYSQTLGVPSQTSVELSQRHNNLYYFYKGDIINIVAKRKNGYKLPSLGKQGDISALVRSKQIVLSEENMLVIESGEQGVPVQLVNEALDSTEYVYLNVISDYADNPAKIRETQIYVGDIINVPLSPKYRIGTRSHRKPGVGFSADGNNIADITFTSDVTVKVPGVSILTVNLQQGALRIYTGQYMLSAVAEFSRISNISPMQIDYRTISSDALTPVSGYGPEEYFLSTFKMTYSCKRYWLDAITSKYNRFTQNNVPNYFSYTYDCDIWPEKTVIEGSYIINADGKGISLTVSNYDTDWVANLSDRAKLIPQVIII